MTDAPAKNTLVEMIASPRSNDSTHCTAADYDRLYRESIDDPDGFWSRQAERLDWQTAPAQSLMPICWQRSSKWPIA